MSANLRFAHVSMLCCRYDQNHADIFSAKAVRLLSSSS